MNSATDASALDPLAQTLIAAASSADRAQALDAWLATEPSYDAMSAVFKVLSAKDKGVAKRLREKMDEAKRLVEAEALAVLWADKAQQLLAAQRLPLGDAMAWSRDAAKAGAPLSKEPLLSLKQALGDAVKAVEDAQHQVLVAKEAAVLLAQRIETLSTKPVQEALAGRDGVGQDVAAWQQQADSLPQAACWHSVEPKYATQLTSAAEQLALVWQAFNDAAQAAQTAWEDDTAALPAVPVWADEITVRRGGVPALAVPAGVAKPAPNPVAEAEVAKALAALVDELPAANAKNTAKRSQTLKQVIKQHGRFVGDELQAAVKAALAQAAELEGAQRAEVDKVREALIARAQALTQTEDGKALGGKKLQEALRNLREEWKACDKNGLPNHGMWKTFDEACNQAHAVIDQWLTQVKAQSAAHKAQRAALLDELKAWAEAHAASEDWKSHLRELHKFADRWRNSGHLHEKLFAEMQGQWKAAMKAASAPLEAAQKASLAVRHGLIEEAQRIGAADGLQLAAIKALQQTWQAEAARVPLDRKTEQKLWEQFRQPIDEAFAKKDTQRSQRQPALSAHDQQVLDAAKAVDQAVAKGDAVAIQQALDAMQAAVHAQAESATADSPVSTEGTEAPTEAAAKPATSKPLRAMRGDDRHGSTAAAAPASRPGKPGDRTARPPRFERDEPRRPRLGDAAFRAQRDAVEHAQMALRKLAAQAHGEVLGQLLSAWEGRDAAQMPSAQALGGKLGGAGRTAWAGALGKVAQGDAAVAMMRLEMAAEVPTPAEHLDARRQLQLQLLTRRNDPSPQQTWVQDAAAVLASAHTPEAAKRLQATLKVLLKR